MLFNLSLFNFRELTLPLHFKNTIAMAGKVVLHYFNGRGKMESIRWLLTVAEVEVSDGCDDINPKLGCLSRTPNFLNVL